MAMATGAREEEMAMGMWDADPDRQQAVIPPREDAIGRVSPGCVTGAIELNRPRRAPRLP